ncbi:MAG: hypothetical protein U0822_07580 [Anaerolineae bacterium]
MATAPIPASSTESVTRLRLPSLAGISPARLAILVLVATFLFAAAAFLYLNLAASVSGASSRIKDLAGERRTLEWQLADKQKQLAQLTDPTRLEARATQLGFRPARGVTYLTVSADTASQLQAAGRVRSDLRAAAPQPEQTAWDGVFSQFSRWLDH